MFHFNRRILTPIVLVASLQFALLGCGQRAGTQVDDTSLSSSTSSTSSNFDGSIFTDTTTPLAATSSSTTSTGATVATKSVPPLTGATSSATPSLSATTSIPVSTPSVQPTPTHIVVAPAFRLQANIVKTVTHGILWFKTLEATVQVQNPTFLARQTGTLTVSFYLNGAVVETQTLLVGLNPAEIRDYSVTSTKHADIASASVSTN